MSTCAHDEYVSNRVLAEAHDHNYCLTCGFCWTTPLPTVNTPFYAERSTKVSAKLEDRIVPEGFVSSEEVQEYVQAHISAQRKD